MGFFSQKYSFLAFEADNPFHISYAFSYSFERRELVVYISHDSFSAKHATINES
jgi:hypothetical protein